MKNLKLILFVIFIPFILSAQVLRVTASVTYEHLQITEHKYLEAFHGQVEDYFNNYSWTDDEYETDVTVNINIIIETVQEKSFERIYKAQFLIKSVSGESFYDKEWEFPYQPGHLFEHGNPIFDPLCKFLDYYAYLVLAGELDTYGPVMGTQFYDAAQNIANRGMMSEYTRGWNTRLEELQKITNVRTRPLREAKPDFFEALYLMEEGKMAEAREFGLKVIAAIEKVVNEQPNNKYLRTFFEAHHVNFAKLFAHDGEILSRLIIYDNKHRESYREAM